MEHTGTTTCLVHPESTMPDLPEGVPARHWQEAQVAISGRDASLLVHDVSHNGRQADRFGQVSRTSNSLNMRNASPRLKNMKYYFSLLICLLSFLSQAQARMDESMVDPVGKSYSYFSDNGLYEVVITDRHPFPGWSLKKKGQELWNRAVMSEPGGAAISDNGEVITLPLWGWRDEGGSSGIALFNGQGEQVREIVFRNTDGSESLRWVRRTAISPEGARIAIGQNGRESSLVTMFDAAGGNILWETKAGLPELDDLRVSANGEYTLAATSKYGTGNMEFVLFDNQGRAVWSEKRSRNLSWDVKVYGRFLSDGKGFEIYDLKSKIFMKHRIPIQKRSLQNLR